MTGLLLEYLEPNLARLTESFDSAGKTLFMSGRMMTGEQKNANRRIYPRTELSNAVARINETYRRGETICGELNHPSTLSIDLKNVSHVITEAWMDGNDAFGKCKILDTPSGLIVQQLIKGGVKLGVSSRGTGDVNEGVVSNFDFVTLDIVAQPSGPGCFPDIIRESTEDTKILTLAEAVKNDPAAQRYFVAEIQRFLSNIK